MHPRDQKKVCILEKIDRSIRTFPPLQPPLNVTQFCGLRDKSQDQHGSNELEGIIA